MKQPISTKRLIKPITLGKLKLKNNIIYSPLAGCSDYPFRKMVAHFHDGLSFCEMVKMDALLRYDKNTFSMLDYDPSMRPLGAQLCGSKPELAGLSAKIIEDLGFDLVDLNCGCPVDKVTKDGSGSGLLKYPEKIADIIAKMVASTSIPVTLKIRTGWDDTMLNAIEVMKLAKEAGAVAISIHGRTREQKYKGFADWDYIKECKKQAQGMIVFGNGDLFTPEKALLELESSGTDGILISRGGMGAPWMGENVKRLDRGEPLIEVNSDLIKTTLLQHMEYIAKYQGDRKAVLSMRRVGCWYLKDHPLSKKLRMKLNKASNLKEMELLIHSFNWNESPDLIMA
ncbi:tRNA dihydrouridine synthase DusB [Candidatus Aerophobetes bacterium]|uniref:tRNA-dihydrouridine synthase n=1 Tax=Aerophobetes bacterium TaxID=2030807 RepID=A0A2A4X4Z5_UNCAE|nr:MAG: tRNA dihydrouridine synthase DusB [Candidatus Aerophobetes bacterium]